MHLNDQYVLGVLFATISQLPWSVFNLMAKPGDDVLE